MQWTPIVMAWGFTSLALVAEHISLWAQPWRLDAPYNYIVGVLTILAGCAVWASLVRGPISTDEAFVAYAAISVGSGFWVAVAYYVRARLARGKQQAEKRGQLQGEIVGAARGLINDLEGLGDGTNDPRRHN